MFSIQERTIVVSEHVGKSLSEQSVHSYDDVLKIFYQVASGMSHIEQLDFTIHTLEPKNVLIDELGNAKLFNYGMYYQTNQGEYVTFPIGFVFLAYPHNLFHNQSYFNRNNIFSYGSNIRYTSPERILGSKDNILGDIWSLGIIITELIFDTPLWPSLNLAQFTRKILSLVNTKNVLEKIARECNLMDKYNELNPTFRNLLESCLSIAPKNRPYPRQILEHELFQENIESYQYTKPVPSESLLLQCPLKQVYYWYENEHSHIFGRKTFDIRFSCPLVTYLGGS